MGIHRPSKQKNLRTEIKDEEDLYYNMNLKPLSGTVHPMMWDNVGVASVGGVFCQSDWFVGGKLEPCPISCTLAQVNKLEEKGLRLYSHFQLELELITETNEVPSRENINKYMVELDIRLEQAGVNLESFYSNHSHPNQLVISMRAEWGIKAADNLFTLKEAAINIAKQFNMKTVLRNKPLNNSKINNLYTISLWNATGENVFCGTDGELSEVGRYFMAGLNEHSHAVSTFSSSDKVEFRTKSHVPSGPFIEICLPSSAVNPYLVVSVVMATGLSGMESKMEKKTGLVYQRQVKYLNNSLNQNSVVTEALGEELIKWFLKKKSWV